jgi:hypothetical protein
MSTGNQKSEFNLEEKLGQLNLTPSQREHAVGAMRVATDAVEVVAAITAAVKRIAGALSLKPSVRA